MEELQSESAYRPLDFMDGNHMSVGGEVPMDQQPLQGGAVDFQNWKTQLPLDVRCRNINRIFETLKQRIPSSEQEQEKELQEIKKTAIRYEEMVYITSTSQAHYLRRISLRMMKEESQILQTNAANTSRNSFDLGNTGAEDWQEVVYQKIKSLKNIYLPDMNEMVVKIATKLQCETLPQQPINEQFANLKLLKAKLEHVIQFMRQNKNDIYMRGKQELDSYEEYIIDLLLECGNHESMVGFLSSQTGTTNSSFTKQFLGRLQRQQFLKRQEQLQLRTQHIQPYMHPRLMKRVVNQKRMQHRHFSNEQRHQMFAQYLPGHEKLHILSQQLLQVQRASPQSTRGIFDSSLLAEFTSLDIGVHGNASTRRSNTVEQDTDQLIEGMQKLMHTGEIDLNPKETVACEGGLGGQAATGADEDMKCI